MSKNQPKKTPVVKPNLPVKPDLKKLIASLPKDAQDYIAQLESAYVQNQQEKQALITTIQTLKQL